MENPSSMRINFSVKKRLSHIGQKGDTYEDLVLLLLRFKDAHEKEFNDYVDSIKRGD